MEDQLNAFACCGQTVAILCVLAAWTFCGPGSQLQDTGSAVAATVIIMVLVIGWGLVLVVQGTRMGSSSVVAAAKSDRTQQPQGLGTGGSASGGAELLNALGGPLLPPEARSADELGGEESSSADALIGAPEMQANPAAASAAETEREELVELKLTGE